MVVLLKEELLGTILFEVDTDLAVKSLGSSPTAGSCVTLSDVHSASWSRFPSCKTENKENLYSLQLQHPTVLSSVVEEEKVDHRRRPARFPVQK